MTGNELRRKFLEFFKGKQHKILPSASLVPEDPTVLLTIAGMVPFKPIFLGTVPRPFSRATTSQKCVRTNDIENVGKTARHHTFFEMLGNFSFGDYFKEEAIAWGWEFLTEVLKLPKEKLWVTVFNDDDEAYSIWHDKLGISAERIIKMGEDTNFWAMGPTGPCGPCSEIYYDLGAELGCEQASCSVGCDCDRYLEIWNLVFMQFNREEDGSLIPLPKKNIDTGMGLERIASVMQGVKSNFDTDLIKPLIDYTAEIAGISDIDNEKAAVSLRVIADHVRATTFMISDGILPANEGRGYVLRRILRRAVRHGKLLGIKQPFFNTIAEKVIEMMGEPYPELIEKKDYILRVVKIEEERFQETLDQGLQLLNEIISKEKQSKNRLLSGDDAFRLYDTYGFPIELTKEIAQESGLAVDISGFELEMERQRERARAAHKDTAQTTSNLGELLSRAKIDKTVFCGYDTLETKARTVALVKGEELIVTAVEGQEIYIIFDKTSFYGESGGQVGDCGLIFGNGLKAEITDTQKIVGDIITHKARILQGRISVGDEVVVRVDPKFRAKIAANHSATHLLHSALKIVLGDHVQQAGSLVSSDRLRFDFTHFQPVTSQELKEIENLINQKIRANLPVEAIITSLAEAKQQGATALFGEKYGNTVRMVRMGKFSSELCGGTHAKSTGELGLFKLITQTGIGSGLRRIEALTGQAALEYLNDCEEIVIQLAEQLKAPFADVSIRVNDLISTLKDKDKIIRGLREKLLILEIDEIVKTTKQIEGIKVLAAQVDSPGMDALRSIVDIARNKLGSAVIVLGSVHDGKVNLVTVVTNDLIDKGLHAGKLIKEVAKITEGGGGGRPEMAQAGGKNPAKLGEALNLVTKLVEQQLKNAV